MALEESLTEPYTRLLLNLAEDAGYSAQAYFEAAKSSEFWGRTIVFVPAVLGAIAGVVVAVSGIREWGAVSAVAGAVAATASFLGADKKSGPFKDSARKFTNLRHRASTEAQLASRNESETSLARVLRSLRDEYESAVSASEPVPGRSFRKAQARIGQGVLRYEADQAP